MRRDIQELSDTAFDIVVVGGGVLGAFIAWCAVRRGYSAALLEKRDFASGTTAGSGKVLHGGIRYLQGVHLALLREAQAEQQAVADMAPHLVRPLQFLVLPGRDSVSNHLKLRSAAGVWRAFRSMAGNGLDLGPTEFVTSGRRPDLAPWLDSLDRSSGLLYGDLQIRSPERLVIALCGAAASMGAVAANYLEVTDFKLSGSSVTGVRAYDHVAERPLSVRGRFVINAAGAWTPELEQVLGTDHFAKTRFARGQHVVLDRPEPDVALALSVPEDASASTGPHGETRRVFVMPWEGRTLVGATYEPVGSDPDRSRPKSEEIRHLLRRVDECWPELGLSRNEPLHTYAGLYPIFDPDPVPADGFQASLHPRIIDHRSRDGVSGLISVMSVKLTTARSLAESVLDLIEREERVPRSHPASRPSDDVLELARPTPLPDPEGVTEELLREPTRMEELVTAAVEGEMARTLEDLLFRRTWIGHFGRPRDAWLRHAAGEMSRKLNWDADRTGHEVASVQNLYDRRLQ